MNKYKSASILIVFEAILFFLHWSIYQMLITAWPSLALTHAATLFVVILLLTTSFVIATILAMKDHNWLIRVFYTASAYWLGLFYFLFIAIVAVNVLEIFWPGQSKPFSIAALLIVATVSLYGFSNAKLVRITRHEVKLPNLPESWKNKSIVMVSDVHLGALNATRFAQRVVNKINSLKPDIVFIPGDFYDGVACPEEKLAKIFAQLRPQYGIFFCTGNHDGFLSSFRQVTALRSAGIKVLENEVVEVNGLQIGGLDYHSTKSYPQLVEALQNMTLDPSKPSILLKHIPSHLAESAKAGFNLQLSGHTHNGQLWPSGYIASVVFKGFDKGLKKYKDMDVIISSGVGTWGPPMRVGTKSEVVLIRLV